VPLERNLDQELTVIDNLEIQARLYSLSQRRQRIDECLELFGLGNERKSQVDKLSGGMQRRLLIARALLSRPQVLVLDEPTIGLDPQVRRDIWDTVTRIRNDGVTVLLTTHYMDEAGYLCDRIGLMKSGRLVMTDTPANLQGLAGSYMVEIQRDSGIDRILCRDRSEAERTADGHPDALVRQANLEDAFIALTGQESHA
jgi:ABC-2 type transport system ATP-binding protein